jgi:hypothetical protein
MEVRVMAEELTHGQWLSGMDSWLRDHDWTLDQVVGSFDGDQQGLCYQRDELILALDLFEPLVMLWESDDWNLVTEGLEDLIQAGKRPQLACDHDRKLNKPHLKLVKKPEPVLATADNQRVARARWTIGLDRHLREHDWQGRDLLPIGDPETPNLVMVYWHEGYKAVIGINLDEAAVYINVHGGWHDLPPDALDPLVESGTIPVLACEHVH